MGIKDEIHHGEDEIHHGEGEKGSERKHFIF